MFTTSTASVGDEVEVTGTIVEFFQMTELDTSLEPSPVIVTASGLPIPPPVTLDGMTPSPDQPQPNNEMERFEGMLVQPGDRQPGSGRRPAAGHR